MLELKDGARHDLWSRVIEAVEDYTRNVATRRVSPSLDPEVVRRLLRGVDFEIPMAPAAALDLVLKGLWDHQVHNAHPRYFGLFNPAPTTMSIAADTLVAAFNTQLAAWSHGPFGCEVEQHLVRALGEKFGYRQTYGSFTTGGAEANHTALLTALVRRFPDYLEGGAGTIPGCPRLYVTSESHHSFLKAARLCGIGARSLRTVPTDDAFLMIPEALARQVGRDREQGDVPFMVVATAGTTSAGLIDPITDLAKVAEREKLWLHADSAWGGAVALVPELAHYLAGIERADSITVDAHKWLAMPMGAGLYMTRHTGILEKTFAVTAGYMPPAGDGAKVVEPHRQSMQWSRRFIGLKLFLTLLVAGWKGYQDAVRHQVEMGDLLRLRLQASGWSVVNQTPLPVVCFTDGQDGTAGLERLQAIAHAVVESGQAWISTVLLGGKRAALRACITNYRTGPEDIEVLVDTLVRARETTARG